MPSLRSGVCFQGLRLSEQGRAIASVSMVVDGVPRPLPLHLEVRSHSPSGFEWGYRGSGPTQLALAICVELVGQERAEPVYQRVKEELIAPLAADSWGHRRQRRHRRRRSVRDRSRLADLSMPAVAQPVPG